MHIQKLITYFEDKLVFLICDETEINGVKYINILVGDIENSKVIFCLACDPIQESVDSECIYYSILECLSKFNIPVNSVVLFISDAARYMVKAGVHLKGQSKNFFHVTCIAHLIHNCAIQVKSYYEDVNSLISTIKCLLLKNKSRRRLFQEIGLPPDVIVTRWSSWLRAALYYADNLHKIRNIVLNLDDDGIIVGNSKKSVEQPNLYVSLISIKRCYENLIKAIDEIENGNASIKNCYEMIHSFNFKEDPCKIKKYVDSRICNNGIKDICTISNESIPPSLYVKLFNCPGTSISVERSFSKLKKMLAMDRNFLPENIFKYFILYYNDSLEVKLD